MKNQTAFIALGALGLILLGVNASKNKRFIAAITDNMKMRPCDGQGCGHWGASRGGRKHWGVDITVKKGGNVYSPITGYISRYPYPYASDLSYRGIEIIGTEEHKGLKVKIFYCIPKVAQKTKVKKGQKIAIAQAINEKYGASMTNHLHVEFYKNNQRLDPTELLKL